MLEYWNVELKKTVTCNSTARTLYTYSNPLTLNTYSLPRFTGHFRFQSFRLLSAVQIVFLGMEDFFRNSGIASCIGS